MNFLLEIGTEEIPHWILDYGTQFEEVILGVQTHFDATPRRLVVRASGLPEGTSDEDVVIPGPPLSAGDKAAAGFARKQGVDVAALTKGATHYELRRTVSGRPAIEILAEHYEQKITSIVWPKTMYWKQLYIRFPRPIRWIVALLDNDVVPLTIGDVKSSNVTRGHRILGASSIPVTVSDYEGELRKNFVMLSSQERMDKIQEQVLSLGAKSDPKLVYTLAGMTEWPTAIRGDFDPSYLELPAEVLTTVMRHHQKYFSVEKSPGVLAPHFVAVMNTSGDPEGLVKLGNERVLRARFNDARFFWTVDQQKKIADRVEDLSHVTFQAKLGSYKEKTDRVVALVNELNGSEHAQRAALLAKCDLTTEMVKEFTDLQGIVGGLYAKAQGESQEVSDAIYEHYKPLSMEDSIPSTPDGQIVALADKLDTLGECFRIGMEPTGSKDPFGLRRAAQGVVKILVEAKLDFTLDQLVPGNLRAFMIERIQYYFREVRGFKYDEVNAVLAIGVSTLADVEARLTALSEVRPTENFEPLAASFKRIRNILKQADFQAPKFDAALLEPGPEAELSQTFWAAKQNLSSDYSAALQSIASIRPQVDLFFDKVLVNAPDPAVRTNRLSLLYVILKEFSTIADFSEIVTSGDQKS